MNQPPLEPIWHGTPDDVVNAWDSIAGTEPLPQADPTIRGWACTEQEHCSSGCCTIISVKLHLDDPYLALALNDAYQRRNS